ncbi:uncharacterized protein SCHCODRAFT_02644412 [Schizophyllum commune H4-8]|uniref:uncharacterized protein n=1 Tax=Schizophyllum commune (strain H4-8 / FGSC 9210) TaxID=578458 RepID=UPI002160BE1A|nr:uncharacterized protein SCHCODRAFT_02644389 [Schizophyllum commune H4-8]XP_050197119.1 uncharacterized protein SCHCODRAFT_02644412 [Schizophyllum commune H4-8]KAI5885303.1 hypothetical protein SCHCODRAFT_02644389 [Schizophyllum commune H4-8]KAI5885313.1 hypothetical protein SCHCODRAFT_02644412 [Schizophyllum commune H4-8]
MSGKGGGMREEEKVRCAKREGSRGKGEGAKVEGALTVVRRRSPRTSQPSPRPPPTSQHA